MIDALDRDAHVVLGLRKDERALQHGLGVRCQAFGGPIGGETVVSHGRRDVLGERAGMAEDARRAGLANLGVLRIASAPALEPFELTAR